MLAPAVCRLRPSASATGHLADPRTMDLDCYALAQFLTATLLLLVMPGSVRTFARLRLRTGWTQIARFAKLGSAAVYLLIAIIIVLRFSNSL
jgi:predicted branched-subunit amino acid permease